MQHWHFQGHIYMQSDAKVYSEKLDAIKYSNCCLTPGRRQSKTSTLSTGDK